MNYQEKYEQGIEQENRQSALRMIEAGKLFLEEIALYTNLTLEQVLELEKEMQGARISWDELTSDYFPFSKTQCAVLKGTDRTVF